MFLITRKFVRLAYAKCEARKGVNVNLFHRYFFWIQYQPTYDSKLISWCLLQQLKFHQTRVCLVDLPTWNQSSEKHSQRRPVAGIFFAGNRKCRAILRDIIRNKTCVYGLNRTFDSLPTFFQSLRNGIGVYLPIFALPMWFYSRGKRWHTVARFGNIHNTSANLALESIKVYRVVLKLTAWPYLRNVFDRAFEKCWKMNVTKRFRSRKKFHSRNVEIIYHASKKGVLTR